MSPCYPQEKIHDKFESFRERLRRSLLQHTATHCNTLQHTATHCKNVYLMKIHDKFESFRERLRRSLLNTRSRTPTSCQNFGTMNLNQNYISTAPGGVVQTKIYDTHSKGLGTNSNLLRNAGFGLFIFPPRRGLL